jgi:hydrogen cyanide synthase HcnB
MPEQRVVIVGAGPAGMRAALSLVEAGIRPVVIDEAASSGGQIYRRAPAGAARPPQHLYGFEAKHATCLHREFDAIGDRIDYCPGSLIWSAEGQTLHFLRDGHSHSVTWSDLILATGAMDRIIPVDGWTLPGVYTLGGAQVALKSQAVGIGKSVVFFGTGPLLYLVAFQYAKAGFHVGGVLDVSTKRQGVSALPGLLRGGKTFAKGLYYLAQLHLRGIPVLSGITPIKIAAGPDNAVAGVKVRDAAGQERSFDCDAVGFGYGLKPETQLADILDLDFTFDRPSRQWLPVADKDGRASLPGVYFAGDGAGIRGADAAELTGRRAALVLRRDAGEEGLRPQIEQINRRLDRMRPFRHALDHVAFPFPQEMSVGIGDDVLICRCEGLTAGTLRNMARDTAEHELNRLKAFTRVGMGRCQGRVCAATAAAVLAEPDCDISRSGRLRGQAPIKPLPLRALLEAADGDL